MPAPDSNSRLLGMRPPWARASGREYLLILKIYEPHSRVGRRDSGCSGF